MAKIELIYDENKEPVGYKLIQEAGEGEQFAYMRNAHFFGTGDTKITYAGRASKEGREYEYTGDSLKHLKFLEHGFKEKQKHDKTKT